MVIELALRNHRLRCRKDNPSQKSCARVGLGLVHDPFKMFLHGVFAEIEPVGDFFVGKS